MVAFQGGHPPFKGNSPHLRPQPSRAESSPTRSKVLPLRHGGWVPRVAQAGPRQKEPKPPRVVRVTAQRLRAFLRFCPSQRVKGRTTMQATCNRTKGAHPFDFDASSLLDCRTSTATRGNPAHDPTVPTRHIGHESVSRGRRRDGRYDQKWAGSNGSGRRAEAAVKSSAKLTSPPGTAREPSPTA
jgi:hypothetical protein